MSRAVAAAHHLSAAAGQKVLLDGGNAVDAAIAVVVAQGVVAPETCGLGGDLFALIHRPGWDRPRVLNSSGRAGTNADPQRLRQAGERSIPLDDPHVVTVPGCVDGLVTLADELGTLPIEASLAPAISLARDGFEASTELSAAFGNQFATYVDNPAASAFYPDRQAPSRGQTVTRPALATTLERLAATGDRDDFYLGEPGEDIVAAVGGLITMDDLAHNQAEWVDPIGVEVFGHTAWAIPPNSQGYLGPATLAVFEMLDPPDDPEDPRWWHLLIEAFRCVSWERDDLVAEPATVPLPPREILDPARLEPLAASVSERAGRWPASMGKVSGTAYMCVADGNGLAVSIIQSNYRGIGSPFGAARSGFLLHDRGLGFNLEPGHPNELGPGKRPLHTLSPTLWTEGDQPSWLIGTRGGAIQPQLVAQVAARAVGLGTTPDQAQEAPRWSIADFGADSGPELMVEPDVPTAVLDDLGARGHQITVTDGPQGGWGPVSIIGLDGDERTAAADTRVDTTAALVF